MKSCILKKYFASSFIFLGIIFFSCGEKQAADGVLINDISRLNPTYVKQIIPANSLKSLQKAVRLASEKNLKISISGKRHSQGGHAFYDGAVIGGLLDIYRGRFHYNARNNICKVHTYFVQ